MSSRTQAWAVVLIFVVGVLAVVDSCRQISTLSAQAPPRTSAWAEAVNACEAHGGVAVPRATAVIGRSADLPACVPILGN